jgi:ribosomal protein S18 acetylase RimI-like enzyme
MTAKLFRHYKGHLYKKIGIARHSETLEELVLYETLYQNELGALWVRPKKMFEELLDDGRPRFAPVSITLESHESLSAELIERIRSLLEGVFKSFNAQKFKGVLETHTRFHITLALVEGAVAGFKLGYATDQETFYSWLGAVHPQFRGLGIASSLMELQHNWCHAHGFKRVQTKTLNRWREMIALNLRFGFEIRGAYTDSAGEPKLLLEKKL